MIAKHKGEIPFVILLIPFLFGIGFGLNFFPAAKPFCILLPFLFLALIFIFLNLFYTRFELYKLQWLGGILVCLILFLSGWYSLVQYREINETNHFSKNQDQYLLIKINNEPSVKNNLVSFTAIVEQGINHERKIPLSGTLLVTIKDSAAKKLYYGDELLVPAKYNAVDPPTVPAAFNYKNYLANQNIYFQSFLTSRQYIVIQQNAGNALIAYSLRLRQHLVEKIKTSLRDTDAIAVASTLILGYKADLSNDILQAYSKTGTIHVLSVSGAHVAIIYVLLAYVFGFLDKYKKGKTIKAVIIILIIWYYSLLSGFSPAVCRAAVMISMVIIGRTFNRHINSLNILAISAFGLLLYDPLFIADVGFQLSHLAVFGLIVFQPLVYNWFTFKNKWADKLWALCSVSIAAQVITFPLSAFYFHQFPVYFLISNLFIVIPTAIIMYSGILFLLLPKIPLVSPFIAFILEKSIIILNKGLLVIEHAPFASFSGIWITVPQYLLQFAIIIGGFYFFYKRSIGIVYFNLVCILILSFTWSINRINFSGLKSVAYLTIKKHQCIVFKNGNEGIVLTDLMQTDKAFKYEVQPYLDSCQVNIKGIYDFNSVINTSWLIKKDNYIEFLSKRILILDGKSVSNFLPGNNSVDCIYLTHNPYQLFLSSINLNKEYLISDNSNNEIYNTRVALLANSKGCKYVPLKRNNSYILVSN